MRARTAANREATTWPAKLRISTRSSATSVNLRTSSDTRVAPCVSLEAALQGADVRTLLLYEPPLDVSADFPRGLADRLQPFADAGDMEGLLVTFLREGPRLPDAEITVMRASPSWQARVADSLRILREVRLVEGYRPDEQRLRAYDTSGLAARWGAPPQQQHVAAIDFLAAALPNGSSSSRCKVRDTLRCSPRLRSLPARSPRS